MDEFWEASGKGSGKGDGGKSSQAQERGPSKQPRSQSLGSGRPESRQQPAPAPKGDAENKGRSAGGPSKGRGRGARPGQPPGGTAVTKSASLPPLPENKASGGRNPTQSSALASRARSEAPKRNQQASKAAAAIEVAASVGQERGFRRRDASKNTSPRPLCGAVCGVPLVRQIDLHGSPCRARFRLD
eukprot:symbB.v1.2.029735.t1/scaffold3286.1/size59763/3